MDKAEMYEFAGHLIQVYILYPGVLFTKSVISISCHR